MRSGRYIFWTWQQRSANMDLLPNQVPPHSSALLLPNHLATRPVDSPAPFLLYFHLAAMTITATKNSAVSTSMVILLSKLDMSANDFSRNGLQGLGQFQRCSVGFTRPSLQPDAKIGNRDKQNGVCRISWKGCYVKQLRIFNQCWLPIYD